MNSMERYEKRRDMEAIEMGGNKTHVVCIPFPAQGHLNAMLKLAKLFHHNGFHITYVNTEFNHSRLIRSRGPDALGGLPDFRFETIPDGLPPSADANATQDLPSLCQSIKATCLAPLCQLIHKLNDTSSSGIPPVRFMVTDGAMTFALKAADEFGIPKVVFWPVSACAYYGALQFGALLLRGFTPLKDENQVTNGYLDAIVDGIKGMKNMRLKDFPSFIRTTDPNDIMFNYIKTETENSFKTSAVILNTFEALEGDVIDTLKEILPRVYTMGPLQLMLNKFPNDNGLKSIGSNMWKEDDRCIEWLNSRESNSVVYVNFGSITVMTAQQLVEFAWGLANSEISFMWIIRPDIVKGESAILPTEFLSATKERSMLASWCPQEEVLNHLSIGGFLTHSGWNSTIESISAGVPVICWPFFADQPTNCRYSCVEWGMGMEINSDVKREEVEKQVRELMEGVKGKEMKKMVMDWKKKAEEAVGEGGTSQINMAKLLNEVMVLSK